MQTNKPKELKILGDPVTLCQNISDCLLDYDALFVWQNYGNTPDLANRSVSTIWDLRWSHGTSQISSHRLFDDFVRNQSPYRQERNLAFCCYILECTWSLAKFIHSCCMNSLWHENDRYFVGEKTIDDAERRPTNQTSDCLLSYHRTFGARDVNLDHGLTVLTICSSKNLDLSLAGV